MDDSGVDGCGTDAAPAMPVVEGNREENIGCLGPAVSDERIVSRPLEIGVAQVHIGEAMPGRREGDQASAGADQRSNAIYLNNTKWPKWLVPNCVSNRSTMCPNGVVMTPGDFHGPQGHGLQKTGMATRPSCA